MAILANKVAIVTGAGSGIGRAIALAYAKEGAKLVVSDINEAGGQETLSLIAAAGGVASFFKADTSSAEDNRQLVDKAIQEYGGLHIACNNAGIGGPLAATADYPIDGWNKVIGVNLNGVFYGMHFQIQALLKSGGGAIINMASILGAVGTRFSPAYVAAKHGVLGLTKAAALEYANQGVRINCIGPGYIRTPLLTNNLDEATLEQIKGLHPIGRLGDADEVAELALWLSSDKASFVTGAYYPVDGGYLAQ
ncbi:glucose 1-dehydrogenase [Flavihumibacter sp. CACIAM 22H1]|uniref:SDR family NAD(P)-dependent oxidoreductase n=1 Tax=Flavihumibacter sp. CACIAM 22H1 TaxID=1812911 RepID=UPI0007A8203B|nr:glucose 1-dehydrogenase [Flavihumibacter sp. CACIAM 22H1]KYP15901.1 MAG: short-chain dehydrogenase [Flavihumibacter sp. CACIAM 22H1]